jgi:ABC-type transporter Mla MlaB component
MGPCRQTGSTGSGGGREVKGVTVLGVVTTPGVRRFRLVGELDDSGVGRVVEALHIRRGTAGDVQLDLRRLTCRDGSVILLFMHVSALLGTGGRLSLLFPKEPVLRLADSIGLEDDLPNVRIVRHPSHAG